MLLEEYCLAYCPALGSVANWQEFAKDIHARCASDVKFSTAVAVVLHKGERESVLFIFWYSVSSPRTVCIHLLLEF